MTLEELTSRQEKLRLGVMGGTFDPLHNGHLLVAQEAVSQLHLDAVIFVPTGQSYHKKTRVSDASHRFYMTFLATLDNPLFLVSRLEIDRQEPSYTVDTLREMTYWFSASVDFYFITGTDAVLTMQWWDRIDELPRLAHVVAASRPGYELTLEQRAQLPEGLQKVLIPLSIPLTSISSTDLRERVRKGQSIRYLVPQSVEHYVQKMGLYRETKE